MKLHRHVNRDAGAQRGEHPVAALAARGDDHPIRRDAAAPGVIVDADDFAGAHDRLDAAVVGQGRAMEAGREDHDVVLAAGAVDAVNRTRLAVNGNLRLPVDRAEEELGRRGRRDEADRTARSIGLTQDRAVDLQRPCRIAAVSAGHRKVTAVDGGHCAEPIRDRARRLEADRFVERVHDVEPDLREIQPQRVDRERARPAGPWRRSSAAWWRARRRVRPRASPGSPSTGRASRCRRNPTEGARSKNVVWRSS